jgi:leucyl-tRNA synthetase
MMIFINEFGGMSKLPREAAENFVKLLAPFAPHISEELWQMLGHAGTIAYVTWPSYDPDMIKADEIEIAVQFMGRPRVKLMIPSGSTPAQMESIAIKNEQVIKLIAGKNIKKIVAVPGRLVNIVTD